MTPKTRDEVIEVMARAIWGQGMRSLDACANKQYCLAWPCTCAIDYATKALTALESSGCAVVPVEITDDMMGIDHSKGTWQDVWDRLLSANPYRRQGNE